MKRIVKNTLLGICTVALLAGCSSKEVEYDGSTTEDATQNQAQYTNEVESADTQAAGIAGIEEQVVNDQEQLVSSSLSAVTNDTLNNVESEIEGNTVLLESIHFGFDKFNLTDDMREVTTSNYKKIQMVQEVYKDIKVKLEGNTDEWGTDEYNYALGLKRAKTVKDALVADGIEAQKIIMVSFGESNPICTQKNTTCWKMNRRVDYRLLP